MDFNQAKTDTAAVFPSQRLLGWEWGQVLVNGMQGKVLGVSRKSFLLIEEADKEQALFSFPLDS